MLQDLPELVLDLISNCLSYEDILTLRSTCKDLKRFVDRKQFTRLTLFASNYSYHRQLFYTNKPIGYAHSYHSNDLTIFDSSRFRQQFANVQQMIICDKRYWGLVNSGSIFDLSLLEDFRQLSHLEINEIFHIQGKLELQELRIAAFVGNGGEQNSPFKLNCPKLQNLRINHFNPVLTADNRLEYLHYVNSGDPTDYLKSMSPNLRRLSTICFESIWQSLKFLSGLKTGSLSLPSLDLIKIEEDILFLERLNELANSLEGLKRDPTKGHIQNTFNGIPVHSPDEFRRINSLITAYNSEASEENRLDRGDLRNRGLLFLNENPELNCLFPGVKYVILEENTELSKELIKKLRGIRSLEFITQCKPSYLQFELFARTFKTLGFLSLYHQIVTERLLEMLAGHLVGLEYMQIFECQYETVKPLAKFRNLENATLDFDPLKDELAYIYEKSRTLQKVIICGYPAFHLTRTVTLPKVHKIEGNGQLFEFDNLKNMIDHYYEKRLFKPRDEASTRLDHS